MRATTLVRMLPIARTMLPYLFYLTDVAQSTRYGAFVAIWWLACQEDRNLSCLTPCRASGERCLNVAQGDPG